MVKKLPGVEKRSKKVLKKKFNSGQKWNKKMGGRSCFITSGAFGDTLLYPLCTVYTVHCTLNTLYTL